MHCGGEIGSTGMAPGSQGLHLTPLLCFLPALHISGDATAHLPELPVASR
jgi:hypothetical protein